jgi:hypothetical protein
LARDAVAAISAAARSRRRIHGVDATAGAPLPRLRTYLYWSFWVGVAFFGVYPTMN